MFKRKLALALIAVLALAAVVAGCGGGDSSSSSSSSSDSTTSTESESNSDDSGGEAPTKAVFIKEADKICTDDENELNQEITAYLKKEGVEKEPSEDQQIELFHSLVLPNIARQAEEIAALTPPEGDESTIEDLTDTLSKEVAEAEAESGLPGQETLKGATDQAKAYGFKSCGS